MVGGWVLVILRMRAGGLRAARRKNAFFWLVFEQLRARCVVNHVEFSILRKMVLC